jgi:HAD superfamily hydrolase (TIGR01490 family)
LSGGFVKEKFLSYFFKGLAEDQFNNFCHNYALERIGKITKREVFQKVEWHKQQGHKLIIISASLENWIKPWAQNNFFEEVIATKIEAKNGLITGKLATNNCERQEKVRRFLEKYPERKKYFLYVYSDSETDKPLLSLADKRIFVKRRLLSSS